MKRLTLSLIVSLIAEGVAVAQTPEANEAVRAANAAKVIEGAACPGCDLFQTDLSYKDFAGRDFTGARLRQADLSLATLDGGKFHKANLSIVNAYGARFETADLSDSDMTDGVFVGVWFGDANFSGARMVDANFSGAYLATAKGLTQPQLDAACGDDTTELPAGLTIRGC